MKVRAILAVSVGLALSAVPATAQRATAPKLGVDGLVLFRDQGSVAVLARATPYWRAVSTPSEELLGDFRYLPEYATARAQGQVFEVLESDAGEWLGGSDGAPDGPGRFIAVPWGFGPGCAGEAWQTPEWVAPGDSVAFLLVPTRARSPKAAGLPVFDVLGWQQPYPVGELIPFWRRGPRVNPVWLSAQEFYGLLTVLPSEAEFETGGEASLAPALAWLDRDPGRKTAFPVPEILSEWGKRLGETAPEGGPPPQP